MILVSTNMCYALKGDHPLTQGIGGSVFYFLYLACTLVAMLLYLLSGSHTIFSVCYILNTLVCVTILVSISSRSRRESMEPYVKGEVQAKPSTATYVGIISLLLGYAIWHVDQHCVRNRWSLDADTYELEFINWSHSLWHLLTAYGGYELFRAIVINKQGRMTSLKKPFSEYRARKLFTRSIFITMGKPIHFLKPRNVSLSS